MPAEVVQRQLTLRGQLNTYRTAEGAETTDSDRPVVLLVHGIAGNAAQWDPVIPLLAERYTVLAPDLLGHGQSAKPRTDYSLGAYAVGLRDLLLALELEHATVVGHSLGGGVAMQFAYSYPTMCERLVLVSSGGLGKEVHGLLKAVSWPGAEFVLPMISARQVQALGSGISRQFAKLGVHAGPDVAEMLRSFGSLSDPGARRAFIHTIRGVIDAAGQRVSARDRLYLAQLIPSLIIWGRRDPIIPVAHGEYAHQVMPGSRFEVFDGVGHFPQLQRPKEFARILLDFLDAVEPAHLDLAGEDLAKLRSMLTQGPTTG